MTKVKFLKLFAMIEMLSAVVFISLAVIFYISKEAIGNDMMIPGIFGFIGLCSVIAVPVILKIAKKQGAVVTEMNTKQINIE
ncbi:MAG: hypothetical protein IT281_01870 [Ignavibacteria bacterium]|nr:hypothetical protein [Ignavibacteria bacterium]MCC7158266.1 hypothetical protein [Ignavibacteria bacterium]